MADRDILKSSFAATPECLTPAQLESLADGKKTHPHLAGCPRCQAELAMLKSFESGTPLLDEGAAVGWISSQLDRQLESIKNPSRARARAATQNLETQDSWLARTFGLRGWRWALPAAAVAAAVVVGVILLRPRRSRICRQTRVGTPPFIVRRKSQSSVRSARCRRFPGRCSGRHFPEPNSTKWW